LYTATGALVLKRDLLTSKTEIDIRNRENGPYMLSIAIDGKRKTWKVIKQ
ncbi:MAG: T9SS C-terminal target domain-containing protein, partial [Bacteroidetes bacterium]